MTAQAVDAAPVLLTLREAQSIAIAEHPDMKSERFDEQAANEAVKIARSVYAPQAYGAAVQTFAGPDTRISAPGGVNDPTVIQRTALGVGVSQYITDFGRTNDLVRASEFFNKAHEAQTARTRDMVLLNVTSAYFEALRANALMLVAEKTRGERGSFLSQVTSLQRAGLRSTLDVGIMDRDVSEADQFVLQARGRRQDAFAALTEAMGKDVFHAYSLQDVRTLPASSESVDEISRIALRENPELSSLEAFENAAHERAEAADRLTMPNISGYGFFGATPFRAANQSIASSYATAGITLNIPLFNGGALSAEKRQAHDEEMAANANTDAARAKLLRDVRIAFDGVKTARGEIVVSGQFLKTARLALDLTRARYRIGLNSITDLSQAQLSATQAAIAQTNATYDYILQQAGLDFAVGILAEKAL